MKYYEDLPGKGLCLLLLLMLVTSSTTLSTLVAQEAGQPEKPEKPKLDVPAGLEDIPEIVARVENRDIRREELIRELVGSAGQEALRRIVQRMLVDQEAQKRGITVSEQELNAQLALDRQQLPNDMTLVPRAPWDVGNTSFEDLIKARYQMTVEEYKKQIVRQNLLVKKILGQNIRPTLPTLREFYNHTDRKTGRQIKELFQPKTVYRAAHILITPLSPVDLYRGTRLKSRAAQREELARNEEAKRKWARDEGVNLERVDLTEIGPEWRQAKLKALECLAQVRSKKISWEKAVRQYSQDPHDLPNPNKGGKSKRERLRNPLQPGEVARFTKDGPMVKEFYEGARDLKPGEVGGPIRTKFGYHIVKMLDRQTPKALTFDELRPEIERTYVDWVIRARSEKWLNGSIQKAALQTTRAKLWPPMPGTSTPDQEADPVIGKVNNQPLRRSQVWKELYRSDGSTALDRLINRELSVGPLRREGPRLLQWLGQPIRLRLGPKPSARPIEVTQDEIDLEMNNDRLELDRLNTLLRTRNPDVKAKTLDEYLYDRFGHNRKAHERAMAAVLVVQKAVKSMITIDEPTLRMEFELAKERYRIPMGFEISHILIALSPTAGGQKAAIARQMLESARRQVLDKNKPWETMVRELSDDKLTKNRGGHLGWILPDTDIFSSLYEELEKANVEKGQLSQPIRSDLGYHLVLVEQRRAARDPGFDAVRARVERDYIHARASMFVDVWLRSMKNRSGVHRYIFNVQSITQLPEDRFNLPKD